MLQGWSERSLADRPIEVRGASMPDCPSDVELEEGHISVGSKDKSWVVSCNALVSSKVWRVEDTPSPIGQRNNEALVGVITQIRPEGS